MSPPCHFFSPAVSLRPDSQNLQTTAVMARPTNRTASQRKSAPSSSFVPTNVRRPLSHPPFLPEQGPDLRTNTDVSLIVGLEDTEALDQYFAQFLVPAKVGFPAANIPLVSPPDWSKVADQVVSHSKAINET